MRDWPMRKLGLGLAGCLAVGVGAFAWIGGNGTEGTAGVSLGNAPRKTVAVAVVDQTPKRPIRPVAAPRAEPVVRKTREDFNGDFGGRKSKVRDEKQVTKKKISHGV